MSLKKAFEEKGIATMLIDSKEYGWNGCSNYIKKSYISTEKNLMKIKLRGDINVRF